VTEPALPLTAVPRAAESTMTALPRITPARELFPFSHRHDRPARELTDLLGGKGAGLAEMTGVLQLPVPPGFTVPVDVCTGYRRDGWPAWLEDALTGHVEELGSHMGRRFGDPADPLLLSVRSGAARSMPGMLDTVLNLGLNEETAAALAERSGSAAFAWDSYRRFLSMYATTVMGVPAEVVSGQGSLDDSAAARQAVIALQERIRAAAGRPVPADPARQLTEAVEAVFRSWDAPRAVAYREAEGIDHDLGTAVNVQAMVFGNRCEHSGTGVVFTRNPSTGADELYGDYLPQAQGEDVVNGSATPLPISSLAGHLPEADEQLRAVLRRLEVHYRDMCDVEFTVECGRLWVLQTRIGKRGPAAAVRIAVSLTGDPDIALTPAEALARVPQEVRDRARAAARTAARGGHPPLAVGLGASPGRVAGRAVFSCDAALDADDDVVLVRPETSPHDVAGMSASVGIVTLRGGLVSHAAVVARGWGLPAVVGASDLRFADGDLVSTSGKRIAEGTVVTIDGTTGEVFVGDLVEAGGPEGASADPVLQDLDRLAEWETLR
jgi:pyruvate,orthophosphate dikinase